MNTLVAVSSVTRVRVPREHIPRSGADASKGGGTWTTPDFAELLSRVVMPTYPLPGQCRKSSLVRAFSNTLSSGWVFFTNLMGMKLAFLWLLLRLDIFSKDHRPFLFHAVIILLCGFSFFLQKSNGGLPVSLFFQKTGFSLSSFF